MAKHRGLLIDMNKLERAFSIRNISKSEAALSLDLSAGYFRHKDDMIISKQVMSLLANKYQIEYDDIKKEEVREDIRIESNIIQLLTEIRDLMVSIDSKLHEDPIQMSIFDMKGGEQ